MTDVPVFQPPSPEHVEITLKLSLREFRLLVRAVKALRGEVEKKIRRNERDGWSPAPGRADVQKLLLDAVNAMDDKLDGISERAGVSHERQHV